jgi:adenylate cyclase
MQAGGSTGWRALLRRLSRIGAIGSDSREEGLRKETLVLSAAFITTLSTVWVVTYAALGLYVPATIPFAYQAVSIVNLVIFAETKRYRFFRACELGLSLILPFVLQLSLGGFVPSSGVVLWSFTAPLGALLFIGRRGAVPWFVAFAGVVALTGLLDGRLASSHVPPSVVVPFFVMNVLGVTGTCFFLLHYFVRERDRAAEMVAAERERSERLLLNVLPGPIADRLKGGEALIADAVLDVGVLFADIVAFTPMTVSMEPGEIVRLLDGVFSAFDELAAERGLEKIKTIGDAYMVASGLLGHDPRHAQQLADMALAMQEECGRGRMLDLRIGIDIGPVVAGVIGRRKFIYDLWGDTVNTASRMESHGIPGAIQVTERAHARLSSSFRFEDRGTIDVKGKGSMRAYLLVGPKERNRPGSDSATVVKASDPGTASGAGGQPGPGSGRTGSPRTGRRG